MNSHHCREAGAKPISLTPSMARGIFRGLWIKQGKLEGGKKNRLRKSFQIQDPKLTFGNFQGLRKNSKSRSATFALASASSLSWALLSSHFTLWWCCELQRKQENWQVKYSASLAERKSLQLRGADLTFLTKHRLLHWPWAAWLHPPLTANSLKDPWWP